VENRVSTKFRSEHFTREKYGGPLDDILIELIEVQIAHNGGVELLDSLVEVR
jgi:hypothetical protein